jgi:Zn-dependent membrane protease YugP
MIATDTIAHQQIIMTFLKENNIDNVQVVLIKQLEQSLTDHKKPENTVVNTTIMASASAINALGSPRAPRTAPLASQQEFVVKNDF